jgi:hypothetical protein
MKAEIISLCLNEDLGETFTEKHLIYFQNKMKVNKSTKNLINSNVDRKVIEHCIKNYKKILLFDDSMSLKDLKNKKGRLALHSQFLFSQIKEFLKEQNLRINKILEKFNSYSTME